jgi:putative SOS response-associated peptidase YedK
VDREASTDCVRVPQEILLPERDGCARKLARTLLLASQAQEHRRQAITARADTVADKPSFCSAFKSRRYLIPADGIFEWQKAGSK